MADFNAATRLGPKFGDAHYDRANIEDFRGECVVAVADDTQEMRRYPTWWQCHMNRCEIEPSLRGWQAVVADFAAYPQHPAQGACAAAF
jgi:hypothetical protein